MSRTAMRAKSVKWVHRAEDIPTVEHWAIIESSSVHVPAEGVWAPGHGYPAHSEEFITYEAYTDKAEFEAAVLEMAENQKAYSRAFRAIHVIPVVTKTSVTLEETK